MNEKKLNNRLLVVDDDEVVRKSLSMMLRLNGYHADCVSNGKEALECLADNEFQVILADMYMPEMNGLELLRIVREKYPGIYVLMITGFPSIDDSVRAIKEGADNYIMKPIDDDAILAQLLELFEKKRLVDEKIFLKEELISRNRLGDIIGQDPKMQEIYDLVEMISDTPATVTIQGENGTGKSVLARAIHYHSSRKNKPFVEVSCGSLAESLLESELFGHVKGAFTGAMTERTGKFEQANGGTIFLDDVDSASPALQLKLLRVLQERELEMVGSNRTVTIDTRVIVATSRDLLECVKQKKFREDLYYRLNVLQITLPTLREREDDIKLLAEHFFEVYKNKYAKRIEGISDSVLDLFEDYPWPGNVRELENTIERAVILCRGNYITPAELPSTLRQKKEGLRTDGRNASLSSKLEKFEKEIIYDSLQRNRWNRNKTAEVLGINRTTLFKKMRKYGLFRYSMR